MQILNTRPEEKVATLQGNPYFSPLPRSALDELLSATSLRLYGRGEILCWQGEACPGLFILRSGSVKLFKLSPKGRELIIRVLNDGATFNEVPVFDDGSNPVNVAAVGDCQVWIVQAEAIRASIQAHPGMARAVIANLAQNLRALVGIVEELSFYQVTSRLARLLSRMSPEMLENQRITQDQLAAHLGTVREVAARSLRELERSGAIRVQRRQIQVVDAQMLKVWADEPCN
jgi:CRP/FNR family transcriptional regulator